MTCLICGVEHCGVIDGVCTRPSCTREQVRRLTKALKDVIHTHCRNDKLFCGSCSPARKVMYGQLNDPTDAV